MIELRRSPRINVSWRGMIKIVEGKIIPVRAMNISVSGILLQCDEVAIVNKEYQLMLEVPQIRDLTLPPFKVPAKIRVQHAILSDGKYRLGMQFIELSDLHSDLLQAWISITSKA
jgi:c-di-GMP-binding flagellar brake protein YcgR